jgi:hypothetical protein
MGVYYLTGTYTCTQVRETAGRSGPRDSIQVLDAWGSRLVVATDPDEAQRLFEADLRDQPEGENPKDVVIRKIVVAPVVDKLLTESGNAPLNWPHIMEQAEASLEAVAADDFEQGYWVDVDEVVHPGKLSFSAGTLESELPEDIRSGLNWSADKKFFFVVNVIPPPPPPTKPAWEIEPGADDSATPENEEGVETASGKLDEYGVLFPETVALIQARNSVVAAWLWRRYAANTPYAVKPIKINPFGSVLGTVA